jgi:hypothetical protein
MVISQGSPNLICRIVIGAHGAGETPDTIPNSEAKPSSGDDTPSGESSTVPNYKRDFVYARSLFFFGYNASFLFLSADLCV